MSILELYKERNLNQEWFNAHSSLARGASGRMFEYTTTNYRTQGAFTKNFETFCEVENLPREQWPIQESHGQEKHKQHVVNMLQSKLFKKDSQGLFTRTNKGLLYTQFIAQEMRENERWLINYIFLVNGYYTNVKNYIIQRVRDDLHGCFLSIPGISKNTLIRDARKLLQETSSVEDAVRMDFFYFHSFYDDNDFLIKYNQASDAEKENLAEYIISNLKHGNQMCSISKKYERSGNFSYVMLIDEVKVFLMTTLFLVSKNSEQANLSRVFVGNFYNSIMPIDRDYVFGFLTQNRHIFDPVFEEVLEQEGADFLHEESVEELITTGREEGFVDVAEEYIDETDDSGRQKIKGIFSIRKKQARIESNFSCALEQVNNCRQIYFTARATGRNYLELHHLIPQEFRNDFSYSIEVLANYVTLCPRCHRQIHLAIDRERRHLINALYNERISRLKDVGLEIELDVIYDYYKIGS